MSETTLPKPTELDNDIAATEKRLAELKEEKEMQGASSPSEVLATALHQRLCHLDHTYRCAWEHEKDWDGAAHKFYLDMAYAILARVNAEDALHVIQCLTIKS